MSAFHSFPAFPQSFWTCFLGLNHGKAAWTSNCLWWSAQSTKISSPGLVPYIVYQSLPLHRSIPRPFVLLDSRSQHQVPAESWQVHSPAFTTDHTWQYYSIQSYLCIIYTMYSSFSPQPERCTMEQLTALLLWFTWRIIFPGPTEQLTIPLLRGFRDGIKSPTPTEQLTIAQIVPYCH